MLYVPNALLIPLIREKRWNNDQKLQVNASTNILSKYFSEYVCVQSYICAKLFVT